jgi:hypothetical protein
MIQVIDALIKKPSKAGIVKLWKYYQSSDYSEMNSIIASGDFNNDHVIESVNEDAKATANQIKSASRYGEKGVYPLNKIYRNLKSDIKSGSGKSELLARFEKFRKGPQSYYVHTNELAGFVVFGDGPIFHLVSDQGGDIKVTKSKNWKSDIRKESVTEGPYSGAASVVGGYEDFIIPKNQMSKAKGQYKKMMDYLKMAGKSMTQPGEIDTMVMHMESGYSEMIALWKNVKEVKRESVNESIQLPHGMELGKVFTGHGKSFVKEESVNEDVGVETILGGIVQAIQKAGLKPKSAKLMKSGFKVSKRDKVGFVIDVEIRGFDKKEIHKMQFEVERGMLYLILNNKPVKLGKWTMGTMVTKNLKKVALTLSGQKGSPKRIA